MPAGLGERTDGDGRADGEVRAEPAGVRRSRSVPWWQKLRPRHLVTGLAGGWFAFVFAHLALSGQWWLWSVVDLLPPLVFALAPVALFVLGRSWRARVLAGAALLVGAGLTGVNPGFAWAPDGPAPGLPQLRVVAWNSEFWAQTDDPSRFYTYLRAFDADVYLLQEYLHAVDGPVEIDEMARIRQEFPGYEVIQVGELVTLSRLPVVLARPLDASAALAAAGRAVPAGEPFRPYHVVKTLRTDVLVGDRVVSLYNTHQPVHVDTRISPLRPAFWAVPREQFDRRQAHLRLLAEDVAANPGPVLVTGDFNASAVSGELAGLRARLADQTGALPTLYPSSWSFHGLPLWRLDWAFTSPQVSVDRYRLHDQDGMSDHLLQELTLTSTP